MPPATPNNIDLRQEALTQQLPGLDPATYQYNQAGTGFGNLISHVLSIVIMVAALLLFMYLLWGGLDWITAGGDSGKVGKARDKMLQAILGMVVLAGSVAIFILVQNILKVQLLTFI